MKTAQTILIALATVLALSLAVPGAAQKKSAHKKPSKFDPNSVVFYRCVDASGNVSLQNDVPCAKGQKQTKQVMQKPATPVFTSAPASYQAPIAPATPVQQTPAPVMRPVQAAKITLPPPPLYRCYAQQQKSYLSDNGSPKPRCVPLTPSNADANDPNTPKICDMQQDTCERIPDQDACAAWTQYDREAKALVEMGNPEFINEAIALSARTSKVMTQSTCANDAQNP